MTERHPFIYNEYDLESARLAGQAYGAREERARQRMNSVCTLCCDGCKEHGERLERERREQWLERVRTWNEGKSDTWLEGYETAETRIIKLLEDDKFHNIWWPDKHVMCQACYQIALIKGENK